MSEIVKVVVDAMGGDNAPEEPVKAAVEAVKEKEEHPSYPYRSTGCDRSRAPEISGIILRTGSVWCMRLR